MMTTFKRTIIMIDDIERIEVLQPQGSEEMVYGQSEMTVFLKNDERIEFILRSDSASKLEFK
jgi:hypothetical protein